MSKTIIGIMGPGEDASEQDKLLAEQLGRLVALQGWVLLTGGRAKGVMHAALQGAKSAGGTTLGILPAANPIDVSPAADIVVLTGMGEARNVVNVLTSHIILVCGMNAGTASEVALALKTNRRVIIVGEQPETAAFFASFGRPLKQVRNAEDAIVLAEKLLQERD